MDAETTELINQGRRDLVCNEITKAVDAFQKACETLTKAHSDTADVLGEPYLYYGSALLELARMESTVLGNALDGVPEEEDAEDGDFIEKGQSMTEEEKEKLTEEVVDAMCEKEEEGAKEEDSKEDGDEEKEGEKTEEKSAETKEGEEENNEQVCDSENAEEKAGEEDAEAKEDNEEGEETEEGGEEGEQEGEGEEKDDESEDVSNLQLAWEVLELAKKIFVARGEEKEHQLKVAECMQKLAEIGQEKEDMAQAVEDLTACLEMRKGLLDGDDRLLAETYYQLALAHSGAESYEEAVSAFKECVSVLQKRVDNLQAKKSEEGVEEEAKTKMEAEIGQIEDLLPEIKGKMADIEEERLDADAVKKMIRDGLKSTLEKVGTGEGFSGASEGAEDISHLVRKKRKVEEENGEEESAVKKVRVEANGHSNGHYEEAEKGQEVIAKTVEQVTGNGEAAPMESEPVA